MEIIALDAHKRYSQVCVQGKDGQVLCEKRINHRRSKRVVVMSSLKLAG